jgi:DNA (cytosine-5)-methyltransferase 1
MMGAMDEPLKYIDLFCGVGGFRVAMGQAAEERGMPSECVFSSEIDPDARRAYEANFGEVPTGDIGEVRAEDVPDHDILFAGFPCQAFSIIGDRRGFDDVRGTLFFDIARILKEKRPKAFVLENVKQLRSHDGGRTISTIMRTLAELGYHAEHRILNALDFGVPQKRERVFIVGFREPRRFDWPGGNGKAASLEEILEGDVPAFYHASPKIRESRKAKREGKPAPAGMTVWHENKGGNVSAHPFSCALRAGASYNYLLVNGERRLTEREMLRLQGFPESYEIVCGYAATRKQAGNSVAVPCVKAVIHAVLDSLEGPEMGGQFAPNAMEQLDLGSEKKAAHGIIAATAI